MVCCHDSAYAVLYKRSRLCGLPSSRSRRTAYACACTRELVYIATCTCVKRSEMNLCGVFRRTRRRRRRAALAEREQLVRQHEPELYNDDACGESYFGQVSTFADLRTGTRKNAQIVIKIIPYFGPFAGRAVVFTVSQSRTLVLVDGVKISTQLDLTFRGQGSVRDSCIHFVHDCSRRDYDLPPAQPKSLQFLCKKQIHLSGVLPPGMPLSEAMKFESQSTKQTVVLRVWPSRVLSGLRSGAGHLNAIKLRVPVHLSFGELTHYARDKLCLSRTTRLCIREPDGIYDLQPSRPLKLRHTTLECFVETTLNARPEPFTNSAPQPFLLPVMLVGSRVEEVVAVPTMTVVELEQAVVQKFGLSAESFLYIPALLADRVNYSTGLKMYTNASRTSSLSLIDRHARHFPIVSDHDPHLLVDHRELPLYNCTIREVELHRSPLICFDVTGPTVPLSFKAISSTPTLATCSNSGGSNSSGGTEYSNYISMTVEPRLISINPTWTAATLVKYVDCASRLSVRQLQVNGRVVAAEERIGRFFDRDWIVQGPGRRPTLSPSVLAVT